VLDRTRGYPLPDDAVAPTRGASAPPAGTPLVNHYAGCFACGSDHPDGLHLTATAGEGVDVTSHVRVTGAHQGAPGLAHGGIIAAIMDESLGFLLWMLETAGVTAKLELQYRAPVPIDSDVYAAATATGVIRRKIFTYGELRLGAPDGPLVAEASGLFVRVDESHFAPYIGSMAGATAELVRDRIAGRSPERPYNP
jgi:acyl-coenzyme A thioesterase PaaI-like protein